MFLPQGNNPTPFLSVIPKTEGGNSECFLLVQQIPGGRPALGQGMKEGRAIAQPSPASPSPGQLLSPSCHQLATAPPPKAHQFGPSGKSFLPEAISSSGITICKLHTKIYTPLPRCCLFLPTMLSRTSDSQDRPCLMWLPPKT